MVLRKTLTYFLTKRCNMPTPCRYCRAGCGAVEQDIETELDFDAAINWTCKFTPGANVHLSGGEPLIYDGLHQGILKCIAAGLHVSLFTNGLALQENTELFDLPISFHVAHHFESGVSYEKFFECVEGLPIDKTVFVRVFTGKDALENKESCEEKYRHNSIKIQWINQNGTYHHFDGDGGDNASESIALIGQDGIVYRCSDPRCGAIGNVYDMTFEGWPIGGCPRGLKSNKCNAFLSAQMMERFSACE